MLVFALSCSSEGLVLLEVSVEGLEVSCPLRGVSSRI